MDIKYEIILFKSKVLKNGKNPVMLRLTYKGKRNYLALKYSAFPNEWNKDPAGFTKLYKGYRTKNKDLSKVAENVESILESFTNTNPYSWDKFLNEWQEKKTTLFDYIESHKKSLELSGHIGNSLIFTDLQNILNQFTKDVPIDQVDYRFIKKFVAFLGSKGNSNNTISLRLRSIRTILNEAIREKYLKPEKYPFKNASNPKGFKLSDIKTQSSPRALNELDLSKIKNLDINKHPTLKDTKYMFLFSFYMGGISFTDLCRLTIDNIYNDRLRYFRKKTLNRTDIEINLKLVSPAIEIILYYGYPGNNYIFPILNEDIHKTEAQKVNRIKKKRRQFNDSLKKMAGILGINENLTSYFSRHTFAVSLKNKDVSTSMISELLGHSNEATTKNYLEKFGSKERDLAQEKIL